MIPQDTGLGACVRCRRRWR